MSKLGRMFGTLLLAGALGGLGTTAMAPAGSEAAECQSLGCESFCWEEPGCESYAQCDPLVEGPLIGTCLPTYAYGTCRSAIP